MNIKEQKVLTNDFKKSLISLIWCNLVQFRANLLTLKSVFSNIRTTDDHTKCLIWVQSGSDWHQMGQIWYFWRSFLSTFWFQNSHLEPIWPTLNSNLRHKPCRAIVQPGRTRTRSRTRAARSSSRTSESPGSACPPRPAGPGSSATALTLTCPGLTYDLQPLYSYGYVHHLRGK